MVKKNNDSEGPERLQNAYYVCINDARSCIIRVKSRRRSRGRHSRMNVRFREDRPSPRPPPPTRRPHERPVVPRIIYRIYLLEKKKNNKKKYEFVNVNSYRYIIVLSVTS